MVVPQAMPANAREAMVRSFCAFAAYGFAAFRTPVIWQGGKPVIALPGLTLTSALMTPRSTQVTVDPARIPWVAAAPSGSGGGGGGADAVTTTVANPATEPFLASTVLV